MVHRRDVDRSHFLLRVVLLGLAFLSGSVLLGCNRGATSDFAKKQQDQENAAAALADLGAKVARLDNKDTSGWSIDLSQVPFTSKIAKQLKILESATAILNLSKTSIDDSQLAALVDRMALAAVMELDLSHNPAITDSSLEKLERLPFLCDLNLTGTSVTETAIARLREKRKPINFHPDDIIKNSTPKIFNRSVPEHLKREFKIRH